jgi:hypothetical protein
MVERATQETQFIHLPINFPDQRESNDPAMAISRNVPLSKMTGE